VVLTRATAALLSLGAALTRTSALEPLARATDVVLDKTGTLTAGRLALESSETFAALDRGRCLSLAAGLEAGSRHPLAAAFRDAARAAGVDAAALDGLVNHPGEGIEGRFDGRRVRLGNEAFCAALAGAGAPTRAEDRMPRTTVFLADESRWLARFALADRLRPHAAELVAGLRERGLRTHLVSGDAAPVVAATAERLGIDAWRGGVKPEEKLAYVRELQSRGRIVAMIGDGLNDAPVLAGADVSIAMGGGSSAAQRQGDLVLLGGRLEGIERAFAVARSALRLIRQNFAWALAYNALVLPAAMLGWIGPWEAALGMASSSALVMLNAMRPLPGRAGSPEAKRAVSPAPAAQGSRG
jgi:Cu2+-exporting ATPase